LNDQTIQGLATNFLWRLASRAQATSILCPSESSAFGFQVGYRTVLPICVVTFNYVYALFDFHPAGSDLRVGDCEQGIQTIHVNMIGPVAFIDTGIEYCGEQRQGARNIYGTQQGWSSSFQVKC